MAHLKAHIKTTQGADLKDTVSALMKYKQRSGGIVYTKNGKDIIGVLQSVETIESKVYIKVELRIGNWPIEGRFTADYRAAITGSMVMGPIQSININEL